MARVAALAPDLFFASKVAATLSAAGHEVSLASTPEEAVAAATEATLVIADLHTEGLDEAAFAGSLAGKPILGFYSHVDVEARVRAEQAGFDLVVPRSRVARELPELVARLVGSRS